MVLVDVERDRLHRSILAYMIDNSYTNSAEVFRKETDISGDLGPMDLLEKKWTSIVRLQQKVMNLQSQLNTIKEERSKINSKNAEGQRKFDAIPKIPEKASLKGHSAPITCLAFHPIKSIIGSCSEDTIIYL